MPCGSFRELRPQTAWGASQHRSAGNGRWHDGANLFGARSIAPREGSQAHRRSNAPRSVRKATLRAPAVRGRERPNTVAQASSLLVRRLPVGGASVEPDASHLRTPRGLPIRDTAAASLRYAAGGNSRWHDGANLLERGASLRAKVRTPTGGAMLRAPDVKQCSALRPLEAGRVRAP
jgi:hypothetical protein